MTSKFSNAPIVTEHDLGLNEYDLYFAVEQAEQRRKRRQLVRDILAGIIVLAGIAIVTVYTLL